MASHLKITRNRSIDFDDSAWLERSRYWKDQDFAPLKTSRRRHLPLIISGHGAALNVSNGALVVRSGFTHYPEKRKEHRLFPRDPEMPSKIILLDGTGSMSFDAIDWLATQDVPLIRINWRGEMQAMLGGIGYSADPDKVNAQRLAKIQGREIEIGTKLIQQKLVNSVAALKAVIPATVDRAKSISRIRNCQSELMDRQPRSLFKLLSIEGQAAIAYFDAWRAVSIKWSGVSQKPIPKDWSYVGVRSSTAREKVKNRNASHPVNAMLNYAYAVLQSEIQIWVLTNGYDPAFGFLHASHIGRSALVLDLMEPLRPIIDQATIAFVRSSTFKPADFVLRPDGVCRLHPNLTRRLMSALGDVEKQVLAYLNSAFSERDARLLCRTRSNEC
jgi:CRISPR-associated protein Cas1